jgi:hypothetical protein
MKTVKFILSAFAFLLLFHASDAQISDSIYRNNITTVRLYNAGNPLTFPVIAMNGRDQLELHFDDLDADIKSYYYTYRLCNSDWTPANIGQFDYLKGFTQTRISNYRFSSIAYTRYTHYQALLPERNSYPTRSGNYILKVYLDGDTSKTVFTKRMMVVNNSAAIAARVVQPFTPEYFRTHQKLQFTVDIKTLNNFNAAQQIKVVVLQNYRWDNALINLQPAFIRGTVLEFNSESSGIFAGGKEWRWLDIRDFHLQSDRVLTANYNKNSTDIFLRPDGPRADQRYVYFRDNNGMSIIEAIRGINSLWEADYATVYFSFVPPNGNAYTNKDIYLFGQLTNYDFTDSLKMKFNADKGKYETHLFMKQGYYDYTYVGVDKSNPAIKSEFDGNYYETENLYTILVYYSPFGSRADELIGVATFNSRTDQPGLSF